MGASSSLFVIASVWVAIGIVTAVVMARRGFSAWTWLVVGVVLGPLVVPIAIAAAHERRPVLFRRLTEGVPGTGGTDVLAGIDGSDAACEAVRVALSIVGSAGRCTLAAVLDRDITSALAEREERRRMQAALEEASASLTGRRPDTVLLEGRPSRRAGPFRGGGWIRVARSGPARRGGVERPARQYRGLARAGRRRAGPHRVSPRHASSRRRFRVPVAR